MFMIIPCSLCHAESQLDIEIKFRYKLERCDKYHSHENDWHFYFCSIGCMSAWLETNNVKDLGFPCQECRGTGYAFGFQQNGVCTPCNGTKRVMACQNS